MNLAHHIILIISMVLSLQVRSLAGLAVVDVGLISTNLQNAKRDLIEQVFQEANQQEMIGQIDAYLDILGDPGKVDLDLVNKILKFLGSVGVSLESEEIIRDLDENEIFANKAGTPYEAVPRDIVVDGEVVDQINPKSFKAEVATRRTVQHYKDVRSEVLKQRSELKSELSQLLLKFQAADTDSEVQKLSIVAKALDTQLAAIDREIAFAANEVMSRWIELQLEEKIQAKAQIQKDRAAARIATEKNLRFYRLPSTPPVLKK